MQISEYRLGLDYGVGVNALSGEIRGDGVERTAAEEVTGAEGQQLKMRIDRIDSLEELTESMGISAELDVNYGLFEASAKFAMAQESQFNRYSLYLLVSAVVVNSMRQMRDIVLRPKAAELLTAGNVQRFREQFGDVFVRGLLTGGELYSVFEIKTASESERLDISASLDVEYGAFVDLSTSFKQAVKKSSERKALKISTFQRGGDMRVANTPDELIAKVTTFASTVQGERSVPYGALLVDYRSLDLPDGPSFIELQQAQEVLAALARMRTTLMGLINDIDYIRTHPAEFYKVNAASEVEALSKQRETLRQLLTTYMQAAKRCARNPAESTLPEELVTFPTIALPARLNGEPIPTPPRVTAPVKKGGGLIRSDIAKRFGTVPMRVVKPLPVNR